jgi:hypothetical protein
MTHTDMMNAVMLALSQDGHAVFRANVGLFFTADGRPVRTGLPKGFSDLFGHRTSDARAFYLEVKTGTGRPTADQKAFLAAMKARGALAGVVRSVQDARQILGGR